MAAFTASCFRFGTFSAAMTDNYQITVKAPSLGLARTRDFPHIKRSRLQICAAKPETVEKVNNIVRKQLALAQEMQLTPETKFSELGADSLDTVEIVMGLEEAFDICVEEDGSENITTIQEAADLIDKLVDKKCCSDDESQSQSQSQSPSLSPVVLKD